MAEVRTMDLLQDEIEKAKESLKDVDDNIKKLTGRDPTEQRVGRRPSQTNDLRGRGRLFSAARRGIVEEGTSPVKRRVIGTAFSRLGPPRVTGRGRPRADSGDEEDLPNRPAIQSHVIVTPKEERSRRESIEAQSDKKGTARNKRMFGLLLGTLRKFKDEAKESEEKAKQRKQIEKKLEEKFKEEKEEIIKERRQLFQERKQKQKRIHKLEQKMELVQMHDQWVEETNKLVNFIQTKAKPPIFYLPKTMTPELEKRLGDTTAVVEEMIAEKKKRLDVMVEELMQDTREDEEEMETDEREGPHIDKENRVEGRQRSKSGNERQYRRRNSEGDVQGRSQNEEKGSPHKSGGSPRKGSMRKSQDGNDRRRSGDGERRRLSNEGESRKRRRSHADEERGGDKHRRRSEGEGHGRDHDRHHRSGRRGEGHRSGRRDEAPIEVKINYDDEEMYEGEVSSENMEKGPFQGQDEESQVGDRKKVRGQEDEDEEGVSGKGGKGEGSRGLETSRMSIQERLVKLAEDAEENEEGDIHDAADE
ncbi:hypothetical protein FSP39_017661 [Pinctada imbricata]|uniref:Pinin n=1 Tax=Pinctada imbricata TaxID=66713 RepID=A0AA88XV63_PINIB|nr:hypothetical protein FSP39_017661 [Pinctada imbricata]